MRQSFKIQFKLGSVTVNQTIMPYAGHTKESILDGLQKETLLPSLNIRQKPEIITSEWSIGVAEVISQTIDGVAEIISQTIDPQDTYDFKEA